MVGPQLWVKFLHNKIIGGRSFTKEYVEENRLKFLPKVFGYKSSNFKGTILRLGRYEFNQSTRNLSDLIVSESWSFKQIWSCYNWGVEFFKIITQEYDLTKNLFWKLINQKSFKQLKKVWIPVCQTHDIQE